MNNISSPDRRNLYDQAFLNLTSIQKKYNSIAQYLSKKVGESIPKNKAAVEELDTMEMQVRVANDLISQIEELKYYCGLSFLSGGILSSEEEISHALNIIDMLLTAVNMESKSTESQVREWAKVKHEHYTNIETELLSVLSIKMSRQANLNKKEIH